MQKNNQTVILTTFFISQYHHARTSDARWSSSNFSFSTRLLTFSSRFGRPSVFTFYFSDKRGICGNFSILGKLSLCLSLDSGSSNSGLGFCEVLARWKVKSISG